jgi:hypothetical protein
MIATPDRMTLGDMGKDGVENVWNGQMCRRFRGQLASDTPPSICASCAIYNGTF